MNPVLLAVFFFCCVMAAVTLAGYLLWYRRGLWRTTLERVGDRVPSRPAKSQSYRRLLNFAGYRKSNAPQIYSGLKAALALLLALTCSCLQLLWGSDSGSILAAAIAGAGLGYLIPDRVLSFAVRRRARRLLFGIPMAVDLLVLSLEAGQSLDAAISETARELGEGYSELSNELHLIRVGMLGGKGRAEVFQDLRDRNVEPELRRLSQVFLDSDRFGVSLAPALRSHVKFLRTRLRQQAYEQARKVGVKLVFPVFFLIFPAVLLVTLGPALIQIYAQFDTFLK